ncbi:MAG: hypothetical protein JWN15_4449 [Firmicutes bacterium]|nr:hypothetical protein [Bacillota bacterium]
MPHSNTERQSFAHFTEHRFDEAYALLQPLLTDGNAETQALGRYLFALGLYLQSPQHLRRCVTLTREVLDQTPGTPTLQVKALINGLLYARAAGDSDQTATFALRLRVLMGTPAIMNGQWLGRCKNNLGFHYQALGDHARTSACLAESVEWHRHNQGPWSERDRQCYLGRSLTGLAEEHIRDGADRQAERTLNELRPLLADKRPEMIGYIEGLLAERNGDYQTAAGTFEAALAAARSHDEHDAAMKILYALARVYRLRNECQKLRDLLRPVIADYAQARLVSQVVRLQRLAKMVPGGEGMVS